MRRAEAGMTGNARQIRALAPVRIQKRQGAGDMVIICCLLCHQATLAPPDLRATRILRKSRTMQTLKGSVKGFALVCLKIKTARRVERRGQSWNDTDTNAGAAAAKPSFMVPEQHF